MHFAELELKEAVRPNGKPSRNQAFVHVEIDGCRHRIPIRRRTGQPHLPLALIAHPDAKVIKKEVGSYWSRNRAREVGPLRLQETPQCL